MFAAIGPSRDLSSLVPITLVVITGLVVFWRMPITIPAIAASTLLQAIATAKAVDCQALAIKVADRMHNMHNMHTMEFPSPDKQLRKPTEARGVSGLRRDAVGSELEIPAFTTLSRNRCARTASRRLLTAVAAPRRAPRPGRMENG